MENTEKKTEEITYEVVRPFTEVDIEAHAAKCGGRRLLKEIEVKTDDGYCFTYLVKRPSRAVLSAIAEKAKGDKKDDEAVAKLMLGCVLAGDMATVDNDGAVYSTLLVKIGQLVKTATGEIKKI